MSRARLKLATIGYEGVSLEAFIGALRSAGVTMLLDVRELPASRRKGFSKTPLSLALEKAGIEYRHERGLGTPKEMRQQVRASGDYEEFFATFRKHLATQKPLLDDLAKNLTGTVALMCFEHDPAECHRSVVADALTRRLGIRVSHLSPED